jgi:hypothetical protein
MKIRKMYLINLPAKVIIVSPPGKKFQPQKRRSSDGTRKKSCLMESCFDSNSRHCCVGKIEKIILQTGQEIAGSREYYLAFFFSFFSLRFSLRLLVGSFFLSFLVTSPFVMALILCITTNYNSGIVGLYDDVKIICGRLKCNCC